MNVFAQPADFPDREARVCVGIGVFDGVHLGHQQVLRQAIVDARQARATPVAITFDRHPAHIVAPDRAPGMIYPLARRLETIAALGFEHLLVFEFTREFSQIDGERFIRDLHDGFGELTSISVGRGFSFGHKRSGNVELLETLGAELGVTVRGLAAVSLDGDPVSSTRIRAAVRAGDFAAAGQMLGRAYSLTGMVVQGAQLGRQLGFPTANLDVTGLVVPPHGVYAARVRVDGSDRAAAVNIGVRPTVENASPSLHVEAHLLDFSGDLYNRTLDVEFVEQLREEKKFAGLDELKAQIADDVGRTRRLLR